jgi:hypothetical protein
LELAEDMSHPVVLGGTTCPSVYGHPFPFLLGLLLLIQQFRFEERTSGKGFNLTLLEFLTEFNGY